MAESATGPRVRSHGGPPSSTPRGRSSGFLTGFVLTMPSPKHPGWCWAPGSAAPTPPSPPAASRPSGCWRKGALTEAIRNALGTSPPAQRLPPSGSPSPPCEHRRVHSAPAPHPPDAPAGSRLGRRYRDRRLPRLGGSLPVFVAVMVAIGILQRVLACTPPGGVATIHRTGGRSSRHRQSRHPARCWRRPRSRKTSRSPTGGAGRAVVRFATRRYRRLRSQPLLGVTTRGVRRPWRPSRPGRGGGCRRRSRGWTAL